MPYQPRATFDNPYGPQVLFRTEDVLPPSAYYVSMDDTLVTQVATDVPGILVILTVRWLSPQGDVRLEQYTTTTTQTVVSNYNIVVPPTEGYLLGVTLNAGVLDFARMDAMIILVRGQAGPAQIIQQVLARGYINQWRPLTYPPPDVTSPLTGAGALVTYTSVAAAGLDWKITVPANVRWRLMSANARLSTSAAAGNRLATLATFDESNFANWFVTPPAPQTASSTFYYSWGPGLPNTSLGGQVNASTPPDALLAAGANIQSNTQGIQAGDQWDFINLRVEQWIGA